MKTTRSLVDHYLDEIRTATQTLPRAQQDSIVSDIEAHIEQALSPDADEVEVRTVLDRLGTPDSIAAAAGVVGASPIKRSVVKEVVALVGISIGSLLIPVLGWLVGVVFLWMSTIWSTKQKLAATFVWPFGWLALAGLGLVAGRATDATVGNNWVGAALTVVLVFGPPLLVLAWLIRSVVRVGDSTK